ncbi:hypothetical protein QOZ80_9AG0684040 [Eleusine coracana subsp. coracana]|nr:hypothetical protein QOZ80_9AG0684040 [Eleusine coracana subsp. coracana]
MKLFGTGLASEYYCYGLCLFLALIYHAIVRAKSGGGKNPSPRLPPGPWQLPIIGSVHHLLRGLPHHTIRNLSQQYGSLMMLRICERVIFVVSSAEVVREVFKGNNTAFEQRPNSPALDELHSGHAIGVVMAPYGEQWRQLRRIIVTHVLSTRCVQSYRRIREDEAAHLVSALASSPPGQLVNVSALITDFVADSAIRSIFGDKLPDRDGFLKMMEHATEFSTIFDLRDLFPSSRLVRMLPRSGKASRHLTKTFQLYDKIFQSHADRKEVKDGDHEKDMIDVLLGLQKEASMRVSLTPEVIKSVVMDIFTAAIDTQTICLQWTMAELVANPKVMKKAQEEIRRVLVRKERVNEESLRDLHYLRAVIKETLRLHPPAALFPRVCLQDDQKIQGFHVPRGTILVTNIWAICRDPKYWKDPDTFIPERFEDECAFDFKGSDFEYIPFGAGRRICPGITFAQATIEIVLANLLYHFDWELPHGVKSEEIDMTEVFGLSVKKKADLLLHPIPWIPE